MKAVLALQHGVVPQNLHFTRLPDEMAQIDTDLLCRRQSRRGPTTAGSRGGPRCRHTGMSGTNAHAIVEQAPEPLRRHGTGRHGGSDGPAAVPAVVHLGRRAAPDRRPAGRLGRRAHTSTSSPLPDLAYTLARRRAHRPVRTAVSADSRAELVAALREVADGDCRIQAAVGQDDRGPVWVFSGQGSQWAGMGAELLATEPAFAATVARAGAADRRGVRLLGDRGDVGAGDRHRHRPGPADDLRHAGRAGRHDEVLRRAPGRGHRALPGRGRRRRRRRRAVAGRRRAGHLPPLAADVRASPVAARWHRWNCLPSKCFRSSTARGINDVVVAVVASPQSTVIGGATETVRELVAAWEQREVMAREVAVDVASHSPQVDPILDELTDVLADLEPMSAEGPVLLGDLVRPARAAVLRRRLLGRQPAPHGAILRRGAGRAGGRLPGLRASCHRTRCSPTPSTRPPAASTCRWPRWPACGASSRLPHGLRGLPGDLHTAGAAVDFSVALPERSPGGRAAADLDPPHAAADAGRSASTRTRRSTVSVHPLLGPHVRLQEEPERHVWQAEVGTAAHAVAGRPPGAQRARPSRCRLLRDGAGRGARRCSARRPRSATSASSRCCCSTSRPRRRRRRVRRRRRASSTSRWRPTRTESSVGAPPRSCTPPTDRAAAGPRLGRTARRAPDPHGGRRGARAAGQSRYPVRPGLHRPGRRAHRRRDGTTVLAEIGLPGHPLAAGRLRRASGAARCLLPVGRRPSRASRSAGACGLLLPLGVRQLRAYGPTRTPATATPG